MTLSQYRRRFPNIDWSKPSPAAEFAMNPQDVDSVFAEMKAKQPHRKHLLSVITNRRK